MDAYVLTEFGEGEIVDIPRPTPDADEVLIAVDRVQLSVTECALFQGREGIAHDVVTERIEQGDGRLFGHEFCGTVVETGTGVSSVSVGERVFAIGSIHCGSCVYCAGESPELCTDREIIGMDRPGALAEYISLPTSAVRTLPETVTDTEGAALQPVATSLIDVLESGLSPGDTVCVVGAGVIGNSIGQIALESGARQVFAIDISSEKVRLATENGMHGVDASEVDALSYIAEQVGGHGLDIAFEAVGGVQDSLTDGSDPVAQAYQVIRPGGTVCLVGHIPGELSLKPLDVIQKGVRIVSGLDIAGAIPTGPGGDSARFAVELVADNRISISEFVTHELDGLDSTEKAVDITLNKDAYGARGPAQINL